MMKWEYRTADVDISYPLFTKEGRNICELGDEGWELIAVVPTHNGLTLYFKRPMPEAEATQELKNPLEKLERYDSWQYVLFTNDEANRWANTLSRNGIPFRVVGNSVYIRKLMKDQAEPLWKEFNKRKEVIT